MTFSLRIFFSKCHQIRSFLRIYSHSPEKSLMENFIFCCSVVKYLLLQGIRWNPCPSSVNLWMHLIYFWSQIQFENLICLEKLAFLFQPHWLKLFAKKFVAAIKIHWKCFSFSCFVVITGTYYIIISINGLKRLILKHNLPLQVYITYTEVAINIFYKISTKRFDRITYEY